MRGKFDKLILSVAEALINLVKYDKQKKEKPPLESDNPCDGCMCGPESNCVCTPDEC